MVKRINTTISTESVDMKAQKAAKTNQAWRYAGGQIVRAPSTDINGRQYEDPKDPGQPRRKQESNFFLTTLTPTRRLSATSALMPSKQ